MAIEAQLRPEINLASAFPMVVIPSRDYNTNVFASPPYRKRQRTDDEAFMYLQQVQWQGTGGCSVSGYEDVDSAMEIARKKQNYMMGLDRHAEEIDQFLRLQSNGLKSLLKDQRQRQEAVLLAKIESRARLLIQQKDAVICRASQKTAELQSLLVKLETENRAWQMVAQQKDAVVVSLTNTLEQLKNREEAEDVQSCCGDEFNPDKAEAPAGIGNRIVNCCRVCNSSESCVLFLPCRHLCSCKSCNASIDHCPVCGTAKKATIDALFQ